VSSIRNAYTCVLICAVSLTLQLPILLNMHNQCQDINLISPVHFIHNGEWHVIPDQNTDVDDVMRNCIELDVGQDILKGALVYGIQRKHVESAQDESKHIGLLIVWYGEHINGLHVHALLVEHKEELDEDKLSELHQKCWHSLNVWTNLIGGNWLLDDATVLETKIKAMNRIYGWDIFISEGIGDSIKRPLRIDAER
jgi:hypothetical protein